MKKSKPSPNRGGATKRSALSYRTEDNRTNGAAVIAADALEEARAFAENIVDTVREGLLVLDADLRVVSANRSFYQMFHVSKDETEGRLVYELGNRQWDIPRLRTLLEEILPEKRDLRDFEVRHDFPSLGHRIMLLNGRLLPPEGGPARQLLLAFEDITQRTHDRRALEESEARFRGIVDSAADGILTIDEAGRILSFNRAAEKMFGYAPDEVLGKNVKLLMPAPYRDAHDGYLRNYLSTRQARIIGSGREVAGRRKDGSEFPIELSVTEYHDGDGWRFAGIIRNLSARKAAQQQLREREAELVHVLRLHTVGELAASLAHELSQPLAAVGNEIGACVRLVQTGRLKPGPLLAALERAGNGVERAGEVLQHIRQLVEKRTADFQMNDLRDLVNGAVAFVEHEAERRRTVLHVDVGPQPLRVRADRVQIEQVLVNLMQNAIEAIDAAGGERREITVRCKQATPQGAEAPGAEAPRAEAPRAEVMVHDTGPGLGPVEVGTLFEPFFTTKPQGLGMGLAISRTIIEAHEGRIWADPPGDGAGTTIRFTLPLLRAQAPSKQGSK